jgi:alkanesulfonate monooxygenase SsuD/methylene tetrahydromethanopterin reductase-like flavin-dependent oxidoreductase (luciferase family)
LPGSLASSPESDDTERASRQRACLIVSQEVPAAWHPVALAEQAALLDQVSAGRFLLGVGRGGPWVELEVFGTGLERYERGFAEGLDLLLAALSGRPVSAAGEQLPRRPGARA